jgi:hypothetical protein
VKAAQLHSEVSVKCSILFISQLQLYGASLEES